ncbi:aspartyl-phosphate phosphatase Spo0E family protein [Anaerobacillus alkaliphilus]|uniref:Aspartyl-phosphate phosphatase Spo0E family protein n=1 Tax=Anaerobacillus alkaliphilus TaxID=1548597 RepID=A0A4Q0VNF3_9BACI|nr:aspartyl-phosphate phosphatase Spo0E family protein [Anaerobacillus alkaliphilus]RXI96526.1 aspartyl-phosphate phosphatase Spo0E family protein [Anaerobacillus alkaliphilus]
MTAKFIKELETTTEIEYVRSKMIATGMKKGLHHPATVRLSDKLDKLLNNYSPKNRMNLN